MHNLYISEIRRICAKPPNVNVYSPTEDGSLVDATAFFRLILQDTAEVQGLAEREEIADQVHLRTEPVLHGQWKTR
jgi:hypothetical protein